MKIRDFAALVLASCGAFLVMGPPNTSDRVRDGQWYLTYLHIGAAQSLADGAGITVGLVDTGIDSQHPDLAGSFTGGTDLLSPPVSSEGSIDINGHGTAMAGIVAGHGRVLGIAPGAKILSIRAVRDTLEGFGSELARGVDWAVEHGVRVINISAASPSPSEELRAAIARAVAADVVVVAGAGNAPELTKIGFPAAYPGVIAAVGVAKNGSHAAVSVTGPEATLAAPAVDIVSTDIRTGGHNGYSIGTGTSAAAAIISGVAALVRSKYPHMSAAEVVHRLTATADDKGPPGRDSLYGYGIVNPVKALTADVPPLTPSGTPSASAEPQGNDNGRLVVVLIGIAVAFILLAAAFVAYRRSG